MNRKIFERFLTFSLLVVLTSFSAQAQTSLSELKSPHSKILNTWLAANKSWRLALEKDYGEQNLRMFREQAGAQIKPFYVAEDFNRDHKEDFAVILTNGKKFAVAIFNAPFLNAKPAFFTNEIEAGDIVYYNSNSQRLIVGPYASDAGFQMIPSGKTYKIKFF